MRRNSSQQIARERQGSAEFVSEDIAEKTKLKHCLGKINLLADGHLRIE
jgi:hypothetical protein